MSNRNFETLKVDIDYVIKKGKKVYFESIIITGNNKTRDKVIRRELRVYEQELFSGKGLKRGIRNLYRLDFFEDVRVDTVEGSTDDQILLKIDVIEKPTGNFMFGGGYSSIDYGYLTASVSPRTTCSGGVKPCSSNRPSAKKRPPIHSVLRSRICLTRPYPQGSIFITRTEILTIMTSRVKAAVFGLDTH